MKLPGTDVGRFCRVLDSALIEAQDLSEIASFKLFHPLSSDLRQRKSGIDVGQRLREFVSEKITWKALWREHGRLFDDVSSFQKVFQLADVSRPRVVSKGLNHVLMNVMNFLGVKLG